MTSAAVLAALSSAKGDEAPKNKAKKSAEEQDMMHMLARLVLSHERTLNDVLAATTIAILLIPLFNRPL